MTEVRSFLKAPTPRDPNARAKVKARSQGSCEARIAGVCAGRAVHMHHIRRRSQGGADVASNLAHLCDRCHEHVHRNPAWAAEAGLLAPTREPLTSAVLSVTEVPRG